MTPKTVSVRLFEVLANLIWLLGLVPAFKALADWPNSITARTSTSQRVWQEREVELFLHFGINTFVGVEWGSGKASPKLFNPTNLDCRQWVAVVRSGAARGAVLTARHHDGFCLWPTDTTGYSVRARPWQADKGDIVREFVDACREAGLAAGLYVSPADLHEPSCGRDYSAYDDFFRRQLRELLTRHGGVAEIWFDGDTPGNLRQQHDWASYYRVIRELQPQAVIFTRGPDVRWAGDASPLKHQFQHRYDTAHRLDTEWVASDTTAATAFTLGTDFNAAPLPANRATLAYAMNLVGNRGSRTKTVAGTDPLGAAVAPTVSTYAYDSQDRATAVGGTSPTWDKKDNALTTGNGKTYQWDRRNRLTTSTTDGTTTTLGYDAEGLRVSKQVGASTPTRYLVDTMNPTGFGQVLVEYTGDGAIRQPARTYTYGLDLISQRTILGGLVEFFSSDVLGTTRFLTRFDPTPGATGGLNGHLGELTTQTFNYDAYGTLVGSTTATAYLYTGEQWDVEVGAYYLRARWYLPEWGRFLSRDTYEGEEDDPISQNRLLYGAANPVNNTDPTGNENLQSQVSGMGIQMTGQSLRQAGVQIVKRRGVRVLACIGAKRVLTSGPVHHIFTNKNKKAGQQFTLTFEKLFAAGGMNLGDVLNKIIISGHAGPHPSEYHQQIRKLLDEAVSKATEQAKRRGMSPDKAEEYVKKAIQRTLLQIVTKLCDKKSTLGSLIRK